MRNEKDTPNLPMILLKKHLSHCSPIAVRRLHNCLSTSYGLSMVVQGYVAVAQDHSRGALNRLRSIACARSINPSTVRQMENLTMTLSLALEEIQDLSKVLGDLESTLGDAMR